MSEIIKNGQMKKDETDDNNTDILTETKNRFITWIKAHKKQLRIAGYGVVSLIILILGFKNKDSLEAIWCSLKTSIIQLPADGVASSYEPTVITTLVETVTSTRKYTQPTEAFDVSRHVRTMAAGKHHSLEKAAEAMALGIELLPNQTLVDTYTKCAA